MVARRIRIKNEKGEEVFDLTDYEEVRALSYDMPIIGYRETADFSVLSLQPLDHKGISKKLSTCNATTQDFLIKLQKIRHLLTCSTPMTIMKWESGSGSSKNFYLQLHLLGISSEHFMKNIGDMALFADKVRIHINDTHPALVIAELMRILLHDHHFSWGEAFEVTRTCCNYTNHTILTRSFRRME